MIAAGRRTPGRLEPNGDTEQGTQHGGGENHPIWVS
jgi:hypothetical protein